MIFLNELIFLITLNNPEIYEKRI